MTPEEIAARLRQSARAVGALPVAGQGIASRRACAERIDELAEALDCANDARRHHRPPMHPAWLLAVAAGLSLAAFAVGLFCSRLL